MAVSVDNDERGLCGLSGACTHRHKGLAGTRPNLSTPSVLSQDATSQKQWDGVRTVPLQSVQPSKT